MGNNLRGYVIAGNWKMNKTPAETAKLIGEIKPLVANASCQVIVGVPFIDIDAALKAAEGGNIKVAAQNCHWEKSGAFTGEVSADMLKAVGVDTVILGHSERRTLFGDTDETVKMRTRAALDTGLTVILCVGEYLEQRELGITNEVVAMQTKVALSGVSETEMDKVIIAYEPVWAIGTGKTATADQANEVCKEIRDVVKALYNESVSEKTIIQYGGSMNAANASELLAKPDVDGGLIGGASLKAEDFSVIVNAAK